MTTKRGAVTRSTRPRGPAKLHRWIDLLAALLVRGYPATFRELARDVPAYAHSGQPSATLMRMFERDKDELKALGIPIEVIADEEGNMSAYQLARRDFYLPYLSVAAPGGRPDASARRMDRFGYRALASLAFEPDELSAVADAAGRAIALRDPLLESEVTSALQKLAVDLPLGVRNTLDETFVVQSAAAATETFEELNDALARQKTVEVRYHAMSTNTTAVRTLEPYGLFFLSGHWYLAAYDRAREAVRNFRLDRIADVEVNGQRSQTPDYEIPASFRLREHARLRQPWELGDDDPVDVIVDVRAATGATLAAARLGRMVGDSRHVRTFAVRRIDAFARWLLSFGGEIVPVSPPEVVAEYEAQVRRTLEAYAASETEARA